MVRTTSLTAGRPWRLILMLALAAAAGPRPAAAQDKAAGESAALAATGVLIPVNEDGKGPAGAARTIAVTSATAISNPDLEKSLVTPVVNQLPFNKLAIPAGGGSTTATAIAPSAPPPRALPGPSTTAGAGFMETEDVATSPTRGARTAGEAMENLEEAAGAESAPYLKDLKPIEIFDPGKGEELTPMQRVAKLMASRKAARERLSLATIQNLSTYEYELEGPNEAKIEQEAQTRALLSAAGRLYFDDYLLMGLDLLQPYLRENGKGFIARTTVLEHRTLSADRTAMRVRVSVNLNALYQDLENKHFLSRPNLRPQIAVMLQEIINGERNTATGGRQRIERTMEENMFQVASEKMRTPTLDTDVSASPRLLKEARLEAERNGVDVLISGTMVVQPVAQQKLYYDNFAFKEAEINLKMYRVDTGEIVGELRDRYSAAAGQEADATSQVLDAMIQRATQQLAGELGKLWPNTMLEQDNMRVMICGVSTGDVTNINNLLKSLSPKIEIYQKSYLGDVLVINIATPDLAPERVEAFLRETTEPQFLVQKVGSRKLILNLL